MIFGAFHPDDDNSMALIWAVPMMMHELGEFAGSFDVPRNFFVVFAAEQY